MAIRVQHGPSMIDYGSAVAIASERTVAAERQRDYSNYLAGIQKANQDYGLGTARLGLETKEQGEMSAYRNKKLENDAQFEAAKLELQRQSAAAGNQLNWWSTGADLLKANVGAMGQHLQGYNPY